jgi:hypothetical protein
VSTLSTETLLEPLVVHSVSAWVLVKIWVSRR